MECPECGKTMNMNKYGIYVCEGCGGAFVPKKKSSGPDSIYGVTGR
jgi:ribosomal protein L37AE/L43A